MDVDDFSLRARSLLRHAGLADVPKPALIGVFVLMICILVFGIWHFWPRENEDFSMALAAQTQDARSSVASSANVNGSEKGNDADPGQAASEKIVVDVEGAVERPGLVELEAGSRVGDAVQAAGGLSDDAVAASVNLAQRLEDGEQIVIAREEEMQDSGLNAQSGASSGGVAASQKGSAGSSKININTASAEELQQLSGIGPSLSQRIIEYRESNGRFSRIEDLQNVSGIGETRFASIKDKICV